MENILITGFETREQALQFISWFEGQGEQDASAYLQESDEKKVPMTDMEKYDLGKQDEHGNYILPIKMV